MGVFRISRCKIQVHGQEFRDSTYWSGSREPQNSERVGTRLSQGGYPTRSCRGTLQLDQSHYIGFELLARQPYHRSCKHLHLSKVRRGKLNVPSYSTEILSSRTIEPERPVLSLSNLEDGEEETLPRSKVKSSTLPERRVGISLVNGLVSSLLEKSVLVQENLLPMSRSHRTRQERPTSASGRTRSR